MGPAVGSSRPVDRVLGTDGLPPRPALIAPELTAFVATIFYKVGELDVGHWSTSHSEGGNLDPVGPLLIVEDKEEIGSRAEHELPTGDLHVALDGAGRLVGKKRGIVVGDRRGGKGVGVA